jgi:hypothetical protein
MSSDLLKKYAMIVESSNYFNNPTVPADEQLPAPPEEVNLQLNEEDDNYHLNELLDQLEEALEQAGNICRELEHSEQLGRVVRAYTRPWLQAWISDSHQMGSVYSMRETLVDNASDEEDGEY